MGNKHAEAEQSFEKEQQSGPGTTYDEETVVVQDAEQQIDEPIEHASFQEEKEQDTEIQDMVLKSEFDAMQATAEENMQRYLRAQADLDNFRRRTRQEKADAVKYGALNLIEQLLPVMDNFERALELSETNKDFDAFVKGIEIVYRQLQSALEQEGLEPIKATGEPFNPEMHQAVMQVPSEDYDEGIVVEEVQKGYILKDKVIRASMVKVSQ